MGQVTHEFKQFALSGQRVARAQAPAHRFGMEGAGHGGDSVPVMADASRTQYSKINQALSAQLEQLNNGASGASTYRVHGLPEACVLKLTDAQSSDEMHARGRREVHFYREIAPHIPLRTPRVLASELEDSGQSALLLAAYEPLPSAGRTGVETFEEIARQLASFHAVYWNQAQRLSHFAWLKGAETPNLATVAQHAMLTWRALAQRPQFGDVLMDSTLRDIEAALTALVSKPEFTLETALTLCHGDCHLGNLLLDQQGDLIWADWQEVCIGHGSNDLTFLLQRAEADGAKTAPDTVVAAYCSALREAGISGISEQAIKFEMHESERRTRLLHWPTYMGEATAETMTRHLMRIFSA